MFKKTKLFIIARSGDNPDAHQQMKGKHTVCMSHMCKHTVENRLLIRRIKVHAATWMNLENVVLSERSQTPKTIYSMNRFVGNVQIDKSVEAESF